MHNETIASGIFLYTDGSLHGWALLIGGAKRRASHERASDRASGDAQLRDALIGRCEAGGGLANLSDGKVSCGRSD